MIITVGNFKGGCGKSTVCSHLVFMRSEYHNKKVLLVDGDPQATSAIWAGERQANPNLSTKFSTVRLYGKTMWKDLQRISQDYDDIVIDTPGFDSDTQRAALRISDLYLIPMRPRTFDLYVVKELLCMIELMESTNDKLKTRGFLNCADTHGMDYNNGSTEVLSKSIQMLPCSLSYRKAFSTAIDQGGTVFENSNDKKAKEELINLHNCIYT